MNIKKLQEMLYEHYLEKIFLILLGAITVFGQGFRLLINFDIDVAFWYLTLPNSYSHILFTIVNVSTVLAILFTLIVVYALCQSHKDGKEVNNFG